MHSSYNVSGSSFAGFKVDNCMMYIANSYNTMYTKCANIQCVGAIDSYYNIYTHYVKPKQASYLIQ